MSERKAINKWYPPDWDPSKAPKTKKKSNAAEKVRLMLPFSMKCLQCNEYISNRRKFNARKEVTPEKYMGIKIIRFHIKCPRCNNGITFATDPKLAGFVPVEGGERNFKAAAKETESKHIETEEEIFARLEKEDAENQKFQEQRNKRKSNPFWQAQNKDPNKDLMTNLEEKLVEQQKEQEMHDHLIYLQAKAQKLQQHGGSDKVGDELKEQIEKKRKIEQEDELDVKHLFAAKKTTVGRPQTVAGVITVKRPRLKVERATDRRQDSTQAGSSKSLEPVIGSEELESTKKEQTPPVTVASTSLAGLAGYSSSDEE